MPAEYDWPRYEVVIGKGAARYRPRFEAFARSRWTSWNWAAFFGTFVWLRYRTMYAWSWLYFFVSAPVLLTLYALVTFGNDACALAIQPAPYERFKYAVEALALLGWVLPPLLADRLYFGHIRKLLARTGSEGRRGTGSVIFALAAQVIVVLMATLILLPRWNFVYRYHVAEGLVVARQVTESIDGYMRQNGHLPHRVDEVMSESAGRYVSRIELARNGTVRVIFNGERAEKLSGRSVLMIPHRRGEVLEWTCRSDDLPDVCLPLACRQHEESE